MGQAALTMTAWALYVPLWCGQVFDQSYKECAGRGERRRRTRGTYMLMVAPQKIAVAGSTSPARHLPAHNARQQCAPPRAGAPGRWT